ncbi:hypothetical protein GEV33_012927 [Tenebrio molitor]|uniref:Uncharacterized protein n=1 Tax=Tenebrio molitor TaxID=7067 RepID=A0A8J6H7X3_TENMO|nr:hypothetical protein GEV33_012927 [Tenebrio molitor]
MTHTKTAKNRQTGKEFPERTGIKQKEQGRSIHNDGRASRTSLNNSLCSQTRSLPALAERGSGAYLLTLHLLLLEIWVADVLKVAKVIHRIAACGRREAGTAQGGPVIRKIIFCPSPLRGPLIPRVNLLNTLFSIVMKIHISSYADSLQAFHKVSPCQPYPYGTHASGLRLFESGVGGGDVKCRRFRRSGGFGKSLQVYSPISLNVSARTRFIIQCPIKTLRRGLGNTYPAIGLPTDAKIAPDVERPPPEAVLASLDRQLCPLYTRLFSNFIAAANKAYTYDPCRSSAQRLQLP